MKLINLIKILILKKKRWGKIHDYEGKNGKTISCKISTDLTCSTLNNVLGRMFIILGD